MITIPLDPESIVLTVEKLQKETGISDYEFRKRSLFKVVPAFLNGKQGAKYAPSLNVTKKLFAALGYEARLVITPKNTPIEDLTDQDLVASIDMDKNSLFRELALRLLGKQFLPIEKGLPTEPGVLYRTVNGKFNICSNRIMDSWYVEKYGVKEWLYLKNL